MKSGAPRAPLSEAAAGYRLVMWAAIAVAVLSLGGIAAALKRKVPASLGGLAALGLLLSVGFAAYLGWKGRRLALRDREAQTRSDLTLLLVTQLGRQDDAALRRITEKGGPAAEAPELILQGRSAKRGRGKAAREAGTPTWDPEQLED